MYIGSRVLPEGILQVHLIEPVSSVTVTGGVVTVAYGGPKANKAIPAAATLSLSPVAGPGSMTWTCKPGSGLSLQYLPANCR